MPRIESRGLIVRLTLVATAAGLAYSLSPGGCVIAALILAASAWATRGLTGTERRWAIGLIAAGVTMRLLAIILIGIASNPQHESFGSLFPDARYALRRSMWLRNLAVGASPSPENYFRAFEPGYGASSYNFTLAAVHLLFGPSPYAGHLLSTLLFLAAVFLLFRLARGSYGPAAAMLGLGLLLFMPSLLAWSISPLKEAPTAFTATVAVAAMVAGLRTPQLAARVIAAIVAVSALAAMREVRPEALWLALAGLGLAAVIWSVTARRAFAAAGAVAGVAMIAAAALLPRVRSQATAWVETAALRHYLHAVSIGHFYRLLDPQYYPPNESTFHAANLGASSRFLIRAIVRFVTVPEPWVLRPGFELVIIPQQMIWYVLVTAAAFGVWYGMKRDRLVTSLFAGMCLGSWLLIAPASGNIGTLVRHRDSLLPWVVWLSAVGAVTVVPAMPRVRRWNSVDLSVVALLVAALPVGFGLFWLFHTPLPRVIEIAPRDLAAGSRAVLRGRDLRPFLKVFVVETGGTFTLAERTAWPPEAKYWLRTTDEAQIELPDLAPGVYDLALSDGFEALAKLPRAFTVQPPIAPDAATLSVRGRFIGVAPGVADRLRANPKVATEPWMDLVRLDAPIADRRSISMGGPYVTAMVDGRVALPATLRVRCALSGTECRAGGWSFAAGSQMALLIGDARLMFAVDHVEGAGATALTPGRSVDVLARFVAPPFVARLIAAGDFDRPAETYPVPVAAQVVSIAATGTVGGQMSVDALVRVPAGVDGASTYRGHRMAPGAPLAFETDRYAVAGRIIRVAAAGARP